MDAFAALADPVRRDVLLRLAGAPTRVVDLAAEHPISCPAISRHLRVLSEAGLVDADAQGRERYYRLRPTGLTPVRDWLAGLEPAGLEPSVRFDESALDGRGRGGGGLPHRCVRPAAAAGDPVACPIDYYPHQRDYYREEFSARAT